MSTDKSGLKKKKLQQEINVANSFNRSYRLMEQTIWQAQKNTQGPGKI